MADRKLRVLAAVMIAACLVSMYYFSSEVGEQSSAMSGRVARVVARVIVPGFNDMSRARQAREIDKLQYPIRKLAHMAEFAFLGFWVLALIGSCPIPGAAALVLCLAAAALVAALDEAHQLLVPGRGSALTDVGIDTTGALAGALFALAWLGARRRRRRARG